MISDQLKGNLIEEITKGLIGDEQGGIRSVLEILFNLAMKVEREKFLKAEPHERSEESGSEIFQLFSIDRLLRDVSVSGLRFV